jgi:site-specific recombinase XerD
MSTDGGQYSASSIQAIMKDSMFCHASAENGTDLSYIQSLLGHSSSKTTEIYTHVTTKGFDQIKSPLDNLDVFKENKTD